MLEWFYRKGYLPSVLNLAGVLTGLRAKLQLQKAGTAEYLNLQKAITDTRHQISAVEDLFAHEAQDDFRYSVTSQAWEENLLRLRTHVSDRTAEELTKQGLNHPMVAEKLRKLFESAQLQLYPPEQLLELIDEREPGGRPNLPPLPGEEAQDVPPKPSDGKGMQGGSEERISEDSSKERSSQVKWERFDDDKTFYEVLDLSQECSLSEVKTRYRELALEFHPDRREDHERDRYSEAMARISEAYEVLSNPDLRSKYDLMLSIGQSVIDDTFSQPSAPPPWACEICGHSPAVEISLKAGVGMLLARRRTQFGGTFCKECGLEMFRVIQNRTLVQGWWGIIAFFANFTYLIHNLGAFFKLKSLGDPQAPGQAYATPLDRPAPRGRSLFARSGVWVAVVAIAIAASLVALRNYSSSMGASVGSGVVPYEIGSCVTSENDQITGWVSCDQGHQAEVVGTGDSPSQCPTTADKYITESSSGPNPGRIVCLQTN